MKQCSVKQKYTLQLLSAVKIAYFVALSLPCDSVRVTSREECYRNAEMLVNVVEGTIWFDLVRLYRNELQKAKKPYITL